MVKDMDLIRSVQTIENLILHPYCIVFIFFYNKYKILYSHIRPLIPNSIIYP